MPTSPANPRRFSHGMGEYRTSETASEGRMLDLFNYYGIWVETKVLVYDLQDWGCRKCGTDATLPTDEGVHFLAAIETESFKNRKCPKCGADIRPQPYQPDFVLSRKRKIVVEVYGEKSSTFDKAKLDFYKRAGISMIPVPNELTEGPKSAKALCAALALAVGSSYPERLVEAEVG